MIENKKSKIEEKDGKLAKIVAPLLAWYDNGRRILPWREDPTPYHVWVSEIMLQQTRVEAVKPYYDRFMYALPDVKSLAEAPEDVLLKLWEGLGYYNRVRNLQRAALQIMEQHGGSMPTDYEELIELVGIGSYTAGAISSIAFGKKHPAVDGNVLRVLARLRCDDRDIMQASVKRQVEQELTESMPVDRPGDFNQAMMELGAMVCVPNGEPKCEACPLNRICLSHQLGTEQNYPVKSKKKPRVIEDKTVLIVWDENRVALKKRPKTGLLAGLYEFPCLDGHLTAEEVVDYLKKEGLQILRIEPLEASKHIFSHREWHMQGYSVRVDELSAHEPFPMGFSYAEKEEQFIYADQKQVSETYSIPTAYKAYRDYFYKKEKS